MDHWYNDTGGKLPMVPLTSVAKLTAVVAAINVNLKKDVTVAGAP
jgi:hypothetical protein